MKFNTISFVFALLCTICFGSLFIVGCGGSGGGGGSSAESAIRSRVSTFWGDWERENSNIASRNFSQNYYNNGYGYSDIDEMFYELFTAPGATYRITERQVGSVFVSGDFAELDGSYRVVVTQYGNTDYIDVSGPFSFVRENGTWKFYGNQSSGPAHPAGSKASQADAMSALGKLMPK